MMEENLLDSVKLSGDVQDLFYFKNKAIKLLESLGHNIFFTKLEGKIFYGLCTKCGLSSEINLKTVKGCDEIHGPATRQVCECGSN